MKGIMRKVRLLLGMGLILGSLAACGGNAGDVSLSGGESGNKTMTGTSDSSKEEEKSGKGESVVNDSKDGQEGTQKESQEESQKETQEGQKEDQENKTQSSLQARDESVFVNRANADTGEGKVKILKEGDVAPDFTAKLVDGTEFRLSDYDDKVVILNFFATWCGPCMREMPAFEMLKADGYENLGILCVDCMEDQESVDAFVSENTYTFPIAYDEDGKIEKYYPTDGIPYTLIIDRGIISKIYLGAQDAKTQYAEYKGAIDACMK